MLRIGAWRVNPTSGLISRNGETARLEVRTMRLLLCLAEHPGEVVSIEDLLNQVWSGVNVTSDSVYQAVTSLRRVLGDDPKQPAYIATVPRLGYRMVATVEPWVDGTTDSESPRVRTRLAHAPRAVFLWIAFAVLVALLVIGLFVFPFRGIQFRHSSTRNNRVVPSAASQAQKSIAVLPFLDLTAGMREETFADGMTEELIDKFSKIPGLRVPGPTSSFYFKDKKIPVADIAKTMGVAYVVDGSVRKSGARLRVAARLIRADTGYVVWSETYDRPFDDLLMVQDDIAGEVTKALRASIEKPDHDESK
jgi:transcriptional activator of cad operon